MRLLAVRNFRLKREQDEWLKQKAVKQGHESRSVVLRQIIDREMRKEQRRSA